MNEIFVARKAFAATFTSCAVAKSVTTTGVPAASTGSYAARSACSARDPRLPGAHAEHEPVRGEGVLDREPLAQELRVPRQLELLAARGRDLLGQPLGRAPPAPSTCRPAATRPWRAGSAS
jgi:hypothetical protein